MIFEAARALDGWVARSCPHWLSVAAFWSLCVTPLAILAAVSGITARTAARRAVFIAAMALTLVIARFPLLCYDYLNPDEAFLLSSAMRVHADPVPYRSFDAGTVGPLNVYLQAVPELAGFRLTYVSSRLIAVALALGTLLFLWLTFRLFLNDRLAALAVLPSLCFFVFAGEGDFTHCSSEQLPMMLCAASVYLLALEYRRGGRDGLLRITAASVIAGAMVFAKLQSLPVSGVLVLIALWMAWRKSRRGAAAVVVGAAAVPAIFIGWFASYGVLGDFWYSYFGRNVAYTRLSGATPLDKVALARELIYQISSFGPYTIAVAAVCVVALVVGVLWRPAAWREPARITAAAMLLLLAGLAAVATPGNPFPHYLLFLVVPLGLLTASSIQWMELAGGVTGRLALVSAFCFLIAACVVPNVLRLDSADSWDTQYFQPDTPLVRAVQQYSVAGDSMAVWGWRSALNVASNRMPGTRYADSVLQIEPSPYREHFRRAYVEDFRRSLPAVFVDAVGPDAFTYTDRSKTGHETFPELSEVVAREYRWVGEFDGARVYVRNRSER